MPQTTGAISFKDCKVELSVDGAVWIDASGHGNEVSLGGGDRATAEAFTFLGDTPIVMKGKRSALDITLKALYTETSNEPYLLAEAAYQNATPLYIRWSPKGGTTGQRQFTSDAGVVTAPPYPVGGAGSVDAVPVTISIKTPKVTPAAAA